MPNCSDCGFSELERGPDRDPLTLQPVTPRIVSATCNYDIKNPRKISDPFENRKCRNFAQKRPNWSSKDFHEWKDRHITNRRNFWISIAAITISLITLLFGVIIPFVTPPYPEVDLRFQFFSDTMTGPVDYTFSQSFIIYNQGSKICFIQRASVYELFDNGAMKQLSDISDARKTSVNPGETKEFNYVIFNLSGENVTKQYQIFVFYEPDNYVASPIIAVDWFKYPI